MSRKRHGGEGSTEILASRDLWTIPKVSLYLLYIVIVLFEDFYAFNEHFFEHVDYSNPKGCLGC